MLSRNKNDIKQELEWFKINGILLQIIDLPTTMIELPSGQEWIRDMINNILIEVLSSIAEQERVTIRQRQREGIDVAKSQGKHLGRKKVERPVEWDAYYGKWKKGEISATEFRKNINIRKSTFYKLCGEYNMS